MMKSPKLYFSQPNFFMTRISFIIIIINDLLVFLMTVTIIWNFCNNRVIGSYLNHLLYCHYCGNFSSSVYYFAPFHYKDKNEGHKIKKETYQQCEKQSYK